MQNQWKREIYPYLPDKVTKAVSMLPDSAQRFISEIRISSCGCASVSVRDKNLILKENENKSIRLSAEEIKSVFIKVCGGTIYKFENQIKSGYITVPGGHRVGFCGTAIYDNDSISTIKNITSLSFRISREIKNAAREIIGNIMSENKIFSTLIVSEPSGGKTTILTDLTRLLSDKGKRCAVIDERGEICSVFDGIPQKNIGELTYIYDGYIKGDGMMLALRSMSPQVIICDEIGTLSDVNAMLEAMNAGVPVIATAHASTEEELFSRPQIEQLIDLGAIDKIIFLKGCLSPCSVSKVVTVNSYDEDTWNSDDCD